MKTLLTVITTDFKVVDITKGNCVVFINNEDIQFFATKKIANQILRQALPECVIVERDYQDRHYLWLSTVRL